MNASMPPSEPDLERALLLSLISVALARMSTPALAVMERVIATWGPRVLPAGRDDAAA
jgi:hypothetical protein